MFHTSSSWRNLDENESGELIYVKLFKEKREELYILSMSLFLQLLYRSGLCCPSL